MKRYDLDLLAREQDFSEPAITLALTLTGNRPDANAWRAFIARLLGAAGVGALGTGVVFFVAANWQDYGVLGRFVLLQTAFLACAALAFWRAPPQRVGQGALTVATLLIGGLLALFGQSYQTGADVYELFFAWAALALPFALGGGGGALWAVWWAVLNVALALYFGWTGRDHFIWAVLDRWNVDQPLRLMVPCAVNLAGAYAFLALSRSRFAAAAPHWLVRTLTALGFGYGTIAGAVAASGGGYWSSHDGSIGTQNLVVLAAFVLMCAGMTLVALRGRKDVFPLALVAASGIILSTAFLIGHMRFSDVGDVFIVALWLIVTSTVAGLLLMHWVRAWRMDELGVEAAA